MSCAVCLACMILKEGVKIIEKSIVRYFRNKLNYD